MSYLSMSQEQVNRSSVYAYNDDGSSQCVTRVESVYIDSYMPMDGYDVELTVDFSKAAIKKSDKEGVACIVSGWASVSKNADGSIPLDWQDDVIPVDVLEKAAMDFMRDYRDSGEMHKGKSKGKVVESIVFTKEKQAALGIPEGCVPEGWFITAEIYDEDVAKKIKDGTYKMFSIQGSAKRVKV